MIIRKISDKASLRDVVVGVLINFAALFSMFMFDSKLQDKAIEHGYALYCPINGQWVWKGECET